MPNTLLGDDYRIFYDTASNFSSPTWVEQLDVGDIANSDNPREVEIASRRGRVFYKAGRLDTELTFTLPFDTTNTFHAAVRDRIRSKTHVHLALAEGSNINGVDYFHGWFILFGDQDASLDASADLSVTARPSNGFGSGEEPAYVNV